MNNLVASGVHWIFDRSGSLKVSVENKKPTLDRSLASALMLLRAVDKIDSLHLGTSAMGKSFAEKTEKNNEEWHVAVFSESKYKTNQEAKRDSWEELISQVPKFACDEDKRTDEALCPLAYHLLKCIPKYGRMGNNEGLVGGIARKLSSQKNLKGEKIKDIQECKREEKEEEKK
uniref:Uncharacterized protein n=1 Tax=Chromera velia CCMP2878 TaxID=1169474 RepID=A0A0G4FW93_9ALVE|eukprot:Cvel_479.t1-p1 / transcript=Cvel_479.t1 / gene=Cvel_479 / organism=Chromera_velia_CCMP2878 / gene_product=hypothetical protein / transcript_product=hypothetical protein / location=Cvel_scaffold15:74770-76105(-) / protein_length=173 / sequence_SO=supercontig / SO=protein_coding / is_pseudo=false